MYYLAGSFPLYIVYVFDTETLAAVEHGNRIGSNRLLATWSLVNGASLFIVVVGTNAYLYFSHLYHMQDFMYELAVNCGFTVLFLVVPEIFALNKIPRCLVTVVFYPLYSFGVDANGMGSTFGPNVLYALASVDRTESTAMLGQSPFRLVAVVLGSLLGGFIMRTYFPDDSTKRYT